MVFSPLKVLPEGGGEPPKSNRMAPVFFYIHASKAYKYRSRVNDPKDGISLKLSVKMQTCLKENFLRSLKIPFSQVLLQDRHS